ncbi:hypothetical protein Plhal304r1_c022g0077881 [Plasmopara halstedii]
MDQVVQEVHKIHAQNGKKPLYDLASRWTVRTVPLPVEMERLVVGFDWTSIIDENGEEIVLTEEQQREQYRRYVQHNIGAVLKEKGLCVVDVEKRQDFLTVDVPDRDINLFGRTDILVPATTSQLICNTCLT